MYNLSSLVNSNLLSKSGIESSLDLAQSKSILDYNKKVKEYFNILNYV